jgi:DNA-binding transcriptional ArsR family regulator
MASSTPRGRSTKTHTKASPPRGTKTAALSSDALTLVAERFKVLAEPLRLRILQRLMDRARSVQELTELLSTSQPNVSRHLKLLHQHGFVSRRQEGNTVYYALVDPSVFQLCDLVCSSMQTRLQHEAEMFHPNPKR